MTNDDSIGAEDIERLNRLAIARTRGLARLVGTALMIIGAIGVVGWLWYTVRQQQELNDLTSSEFGEGDDLSLAERIDSVVGVLPFLLYAAVPLGGGIGLWLLGDYAVARTGGSLSSYQAGDPVPGEPSPDDDQPRPNPEL